MVPRLNFYTTYGAEIKLSGSKHWWCDPVDTNLVLQFAELHIKISGTWVTKSMLLWNFVIALMCEKNIVAMQGPQKNCSILLAA